LRIKHVSGLFILQSANTIGDFLTVHSAVRVELVLLIPIRYRIGTKDWHLALGSGVRITSVFRTLN